MYKPVAVDIWLQGAAGGTLYGRCRKTVSGSAWRYVEVEPREGEPEAEVTDLLQAIMAEIEGGTTE